MVVVGGGYAGRGGREGLAQGGCLLPASPQKRAQEPRTLRLQRQGTHASSGLRKLCLRLLQLVEVGGEHRVLLLQLLGEELRVVRVAVRAARGA